MKRETWTIIVSINLILLLSIVFLFNDRNTEKMIDYEAKLSEERLINESLRREIYWYEVQKAPVFVEPLNGIWMQWVSSPVGYRVNPMGGEETRFHKGIDVGAPLGTPVKTMARGRIVAHWPAPDDYWKGHPIFGGYIIVNHGSGLFSMYGHLSETYVHEGNYVEAGEIIGRVGDTGQATGPHLHWEIALNPLRYIREIL